MTKNIKLYTLGVLIFLLLLSLGSIEGLVGALCYPLAFILPSAGLLLITKAKELPKLSGKLTVSDFIPLIAPALLLIFGAAYLTAFILFNALGAESSVNVTGDPVSDVVTLAIAPALLEEMLFRYLPLKIIAPYSKKTALLISTLFFALAHSSLFSIPHAAVAGVIFMSLDLIAASPLPSVILHLSNNLFSIGWEYTFPGGSAHLLIIALAILAVISLIVMIVYRKKYLKLLATLFDPEDRTTLPAYTLALALPTLLAAILELIGQ